MADQLEFSPTRDWLLAGDPAIRWQVLRDLEGAPGDQVRRERRKVAAAGWGRRLLELQDPEGTWAGRMYSPKWISTTYTMLLLRQLGLPAGNAQARTASRLLLSPPPSVRRWSYRGLQDDGGIGFGGSGSETCVTGIVLSIATVYRPDDERIDHLADHLLAEQMDDGGWNCQRPRGATHSSMNTTILALEGLLAYERFRARAARRLTAVRRAQARGREFLLAHRLFRSHRTGEIIKRDFVRLAFPPQWHFDFLRALDYFRAARAHRDRRLADGIALLEEKRRRDGRWNLEHRYRARYWFQLERIRAPSRWNTLRALRVLAWWGRRKPVVS